MFRRETRPGEIETTATVAAPAKRPAHEAAIFTQGRTFAERKAQADANNAAQAVPRLASIGDTEFTQRDRRTGDITTVPAKLFMDVDHPRKRYVSIDGQPGLHPLFNDDQRKDETTKVGRVTRRPGPSGLTPAALPDSPPRPV